VGIMGGTFDPIHIGHLLAAETAREQCGLEEVWFIPSFAPPLKASDPGASSMQRYEMVCLAAEGNPAFRVLDIELKRGGVSYSYDTMQELVRVHPDVSFFYIIGSDRINDLAGWHRIEQLAQLIGFIGLERPGEPIRLASLPAYLQSRVELARMPGIGISSTAIRAKRASGESVRYFVPDAVLSYIRRHELYEA
jgi:nicotinate-nucleotide adenylyltransferase